jgi:hypothetical protein
MFRTLQSLLHVAQIGRARSSVVNPLQWTIVLLIFGLFLSLAAHGPSWLLIFFAVSLAVVILLLLCAYIYFMRKNPDLLRSETYSLAKTAIEKQVLGDNLSGLREVVNIMEGVDAKLLTAGPKAREENGK